jgi:hypothetical protein
MDFADKRPPPKTTAQAFELAFDPEGDNVFVLSALFPQAFGRKLKKKEEKPQEEDDDGTESDEDIEKEVVLTEKDQPRQRYDVIARLERLFGGGELATGLNHDSDSEVAEDYYASDDSFIDDSEAFEAAEKRDVEQRTAPAEHDGFFAVSGDLATVEAPAPPEKPRKKKPRKLIDGGPTAAHVNALLDKDAQLTCQQQNPKRGESALRYDKYKAATSAKQLLALGATRADIKNDLAKGYVTLKEPLAGLVITPAVRTSKRCGTCEGCTAEECGACKYCLDMSKRGGPNTLRRPCVKRACLRPLDGSVPPATSQPRSSPRASPPRSPRVTSNWTRYVDEASGKPYWHDASTQKTTWDDPTSKKRPAPDAEQPPVKMRKQSGYVYFQSQHREAAQAAVDIDPDTNQLGARERNQAVMRKLAEMWGALDDASKQKWSDDAPRVPVKERKPKAKVVKEAKPAAKAKEASPLKVFGASIPFATAPAIPAVPPRKPSARARKAAPVPEPGVLESEPESEEEEAEAAPAAAPAAAPSPAAKPKPKAKPKAKPKPAAKKPAARKKAAAPAPAPAPAAAPAAASAAAEEAPRFRVGDTVDVAPRTFPGINKAGGTGTITKVNDERQKDGGPMKDGSESRTTGFTYAVKYTISGSEKRVDAQWIARIDEEEEDGSDGGAAETLRTPGGRVATVLERRARGWIYVELDGNANDEGGAHERKSFRNSQLS